MDQSIVLALIGIVPAVVASIVTYGVSAKKTKVDLIKLINDSSDALRTEIKLELEECRKDREAIRSELNLYKKENESIKKELEEQKAPKSVIRKIATNVACGVDWNSLCQEHRKTCDDISTREQLEGGGWHITLMLYCLPVNETGCTFLLFAYGTPIIPWCQLASVFGPILSICSVDWNTNAVIQEVFLLSSLWIQGDVRSELGCR